MTSQYKHADYMKVLQPKEFRKSMRVAKKKFKEFKTPFDAIAFSGMSGALFAPSLALHLKVEMIMVRKEFDCNKKEKVNHSGRRVEGFAATKRYVIVDDLTSSSDTVRRIHKEIEKFAPGAICVGVYVYYREVFERGYNFIYSDDKIEPAAALVVAESDDPTVAPYVGVVVGKNGSPVSAPFGGPDNLPFSWLTEPSSSVPPDGDDEHSGESC